MPIFRSISSQSRKKSELVGAPERTMTKKNALCEIQRERKKVEKSGRKVVPVTKPRAHKHTRMSASLCFILPISPSSDVFMCV